MNKKSGFISLTFVTVVCSLLLVFTISRSISISEFFDLTRLKEYRLINYYNAMSCIDQAVLRISHDYFYEISSPLRLNDFDCVIDSIKDIDGYKIITTHGDYKKIYVKKQAKIKLYDDRVEIIDIE